MNLIHSLVNSSGAKIMAVGDDYQSIYNFSGSDISILFNIYERNETQVIYLKNNYRCCQCRAPGRNSPDRSPSPRQPRNNRYRNPTEEDRWCRSRHRLSGASRSCRSC